MPRDALNFLRGILLVKPYASDGRRSYRDATSLTRLRLMRQNPLQSTIPPCNDRREDNDLQIDSGDRAQAIRRHREPGDAVTLRL